MTEFPIEWRCKHGLLNNEKTRCGYGCQQQSVTLINVIDKWRELEREIDADLDGTLSFIDREFYFKFFDQRRLLDEADKSRDLEQLAIHGPAMLRGLDEARKLIATEKSALNFNNAAKQFGLGPHPGKAPDHRTTAFKWWYRRYLNSEEWSKRRKLVMTRCNQVCEGCGEAPASEVHHKTYEHVGYEFLFELVGICKDCHARFHKK